MRPEAVVFARRPGTFARVIDCAKGRDIRDFEAPKGYHFSGHGTFSADGTLLFTGEIDNETGAGQIGIWNRAKGYPRTGAFASGGIGPHEILLLPESDVLIVAHGGIHEARDKGRTKLNLDDMRPDLSYLSPNGEVLDYVELAPELRLNSIRHLAAHPGGKIAFAMQWQGDLAARPPLLGLHQRGQSPVLCDLPDAVAGRMQGYAGSVAFDGNGGRVAITSPRGGVIAIFDEKGQFISVIERSDVCGIGPADDGFLTTDGLGGVMHLASQALRPLGVFNRAWDNHLIAV